KPLAARAGLAGGVTCGLAEPRARRGRVPIARANASAEKGPRKSQAARTTRHRDRDVGQCLFLLGPALVLLTGVDIHHVPLRYVSFFLLVRNDTGAGRDHQNLVAGVGMPPGRGASTEIDDTTAVVVLRVVGDDCLPCPCYRASCPSGNRSGL